MRGCVLVMAKAPVPGQAKTRLAASIGPQAAADLAAAALLDTLDAGATAYPAGRRVLALAGDLDEAARADDLCRAAGEWLVVPQAGGSFGERLVHGHREAHRVAGGPVVQVGMDTPQAHAALLRGVADLAHDADAPVLGPAVDGGWWVLVTTHPAQAEVLSGVPMSRPDTGRLTAAALTAAGHPPVAGPLLRDVDHREDADEVAAAAPGSRFALRWSEVREAAVPEASPRAVEEESGTSRPAGE